jgi:hypothetical protein
MDEPLVTMEELAAKLPFVMDDDEEREAEGALEALSDDARFYGKSSWATIATTPPSVCRLVLKAANRHMKNFEGLSQSRAGDETVAWDNQKSAEAGSAHFTDREIRVLKTLAGVTPVFSVPLTTGPRRSRFDERCYVPTEGSSPFPYFRDPVEPW